MYALITLNSLLYVTNCPIETIMGGEGIVICNINGGNEVLIMLFPLIYTLYFICCPDESWQIYTEGFDGSAKLLQHSYIYNYVFHCVWHLIN